MATLPIRIAVRVDFTDGSQHEYEVRSTDTAEPLPGFWPEGVVTTDVRARMDQHKLQERRNALLERIGELWRGDWTGSRYDGRDGRTWIGVAVHGDESDLNALDGELQAWEEDR